MSENTSPISRTSGSQMQTLKTDISLTNKTPEQQAQTLVNALGSNDPQQQSGAKVALSAYLQTATPEQKSQLKSALQALPESDAKKQALQTMDHPLRAGKMESSGDIVSGGDGTSMTDTASSVSQAQYNKLMGQVGPAAQGF